MADDAFGSLCRSPGGPEVEKAGRSYLTQRNKPRVQGLASSVEARVLEGVERVKEDPWDYVQRTADDVDKALAVAQLLSGLLIH
jgi:hypothetical protein